MTEEQGADLLTKLDSLRDLVQLESARLAVVQRYELFCLMALLFCGCFLVARRSLS